MSVIVCSTGVNSADERRAVSIVRALGGEMTGTLQQGVSCLVVKSVGSTKHKAALRLGIPCVTYRWLLESKSNGAFLPYINFRAGPFQDLVIGCTQFEADARRALETLVTENAGTFVKAMERGKVTHLVAQEALGEKYSAAMQWNVSVVSIDWIHASIADRKPAPEQLYRVGPKPIASAPAASAASAVTTAAAAAAAPAAADSSSRPAPALAAAPPPPPLRFSASEAAAAAGATAAAAVAAAAVSAAAAAASATTAASTSTSTSTGSRAPLPPAFLWEELPSARLVTPERRSLLSGDTFFLAGWQPTQRDYLLGLLCAGGARRHHVLTVGVTKVLVGKDVERRLLQELRRHPTAPAVVRVEWLVETLVPGFLEERREARRERELELQRAKENEVALKEQQYQQQQQQQQKQQLSKEEKENEDNSGRPGLAAPLNTATAAGAGTDNVADSQSFEHNILRQHELMQQARRGQAGQARPGQGGRKGNSGGLDTGLVGGASGYVPSDFSNSSDDSHEAVEGGRGSRGARAGTGLRDKTGVYGHGWPLRRGRSLGFAGMQQPLQQQQQQQQLDGAGEAGDVQGQGNNRSLVQVGRTLTVNSIVGLKRPSRPVQLDSRPAELDSADLGLFYGGGGGGGGGGSINGGGLPGRTGGRAKKTRGSTGGLFPGPPAHVEETQVVTWHESQSQPE